ncbi:unnamed protein product [Lactuca virosa]|uniref:Uncharacterized protein n=1 Tax=Lactuca virosa TaxID=75947 RepID=A0AAU9NAX3_9ASTR|nr:unnamed protein product [Lactuca virosa]
MAKFENSDCIWLWIIRSSRRIMTKEEEERCPLRTEEMGWTELIPCKCGYKAWMFTNETISLPLNFIYLVLTCLISCSNPLVLVVLPIQVSGVGIT